MTVTYRASGKKKKSKALLPSTVKSSTENSPPRYTPTTQPLRFYELLEDFQRGILPHNEDIKSWISTMRTSGVLRSSGLSDTGKKLMLDVETLLGLIERVIETKNKDEIFQRFLYHVRLAARIMTDDMTRTGKVTVLKERNRRVYLGGSKEMRIKQDFKDVRKKSQDNVRSLYNVLQLLLTSPVFRDVINDTQSLVKRALSEPQTAPISTTVMPIITESSYSQYRPTTSDIDLSGIEDLKRRVATTSEQLERIRLSSLKEKTDKLSDIEHGEGGGGRGDDYVNVSTPEPAILPFSTKIPEVELEKAERLPIVHQQLHPPPLDKDLSEQHARVPTPISPIKFESTLPRDEPIKSKDNIDALIDDLKLLLLKISSSPNFMQAAKEVYKFILGIQHVSMTVKEPIVPRELRFEANFQQAQRDLLRILERFANHTTLEPALKAIQNIRSEAMKDYRLKDFIGDWSSYLSRCIQDPEYVEHEEFRHRGRFLFEQTREFHRAKYRPMFDEALNSIKSFTEGWSNDELTNKLAQCINKIFREDLFGQPDMSDRSPGFLVLNLIKPDLFNDLRNVLLPNMLRQLHQVPLPRIEAIYGSNRLVLENLVLPADAFLPMDLEVKTKTSLKLHPKSRILGHSSSLDVEEDKGWTNGLIINVSNIKTTVRDVLFTFEHPDAFPRVHDSGLASVHIGGHRGMNITIHIVSDARDSTYRHERRPKLYPTYVRVAIDSLKVRFHHSSHDSAYMLLSPVINYVLKKAIETSIKDRIVGSVFYLDNMIKRVSGRP